VQPIILWDIDGTLIRSNGGRVSVSAFLRALQLAANLLDDLPYPRDSGGKTDQQIALEVLLAAEIAEEHATSLLPAFGDLTSPTSTATMPASRPTFASWPACPSSWPGSRLSG
jgi:phosphoglycolate phosphatase-like HAD superfamily hydrolase